MPTLDLEVALAAIAGDYSKLGARIWVLSHTVTCPATGASLRVHYPSFRDGAPTVSDLVSALSHYTTHFVLPKEERRQFHARISKLSDDDKEVEFSLLKTKAKRTFIQAHKATQRSGEAGELVLFLLTEWALQAPQILAKMSLKTSPQMPVHGADAIHARYNVSAGVLNLFIGESKVHKNVQRAIVSAIGSIKKALSPDELQYELDLIERNLSLSGLDKSAQDAILAYLNPFDESSNKRSTVVTSLVAFTYEGYAALAALPKEDRKAAFLSTLQQDLASLAPAIERALSKAGLQNQEIELFLMPLPDVADFRDKFHEAIGWS